MHERGHMTESDYRFAALPESPFPRLNALLEGTPPGGEPLMMSLGEPQHPFPDFVTKELMAHAKDFGRYPPIIGTAGFRDAVAGWLMRRFDLPLGAIDPDTQILPVNGTREALFSIALVATPGEKNGKQPAVLMPNPFYQCYAAAALAAGAEPHYISARPENAFLPDFEGLPGDLLARTSVVYFCSPANPQGAVADMDYLKRLIELAREHDFLLVMDECYADIYDRAPPPSALQACLEMTPPRSGDPFENVVVFHSLSKRSSLPGLRSGFCAGDKAFMIRYRGFRNIGGPQTPLPVLAASAAAWNDDEHAAKNRALYQRKIDIAERVLGNRFGFYRPAGGFFLWLDVGDGEKAAKQIWAEGGVKVLPGKYLARDGKNGNPGAAYIRIALVHDEAATEEGLTRLAEALG